MDDAPYYTDKITFLADSDVQSQTFMLRPASDLLRDCDLLLQCAGRHIEDRWPLLKVNRRELARLVEWRLPKSTPPIGEWKVVIQRALQIENPQHLPPHISEWERRGLLVELETDIHNAVDCSRQAVDFFCNDRKHLPMNTTVFLVSSAWGAYIASLIAGDLNPAWIAPIDAAQIPECIHGQFPRYNLR
ncbi:hypothetical protein CRN79_25350 [Serratia fonticola]|nr:hypothetical protein CRN79_25350 [Serratia fonticola]